MFSSQSLSEVKDHRKASWKVCRKAQQRFPENIQLEANSCKLQDSMENLELKRSKPQFNRKSSSNYLKKLLKATVTVMIKSLLAC